jgi:hypothetical protein
MAVKETLVKQQKQKESDSAVKIQSMYRGRSGRKVYKTKKTIALESKQSALLLQSELAKAEAFKALELEKENLLAKQKVLENTSASKIQKTFKSKLANKAETK